MSELIEVPQNTAQSLVGATPTPSDLLRLAIDKGADLDRLERLMDLQAKWEAGQARKAFTAAMADLKSRNLTVRKDKSVSFSGTAYTHASLAEVVETVVRHMADAGLSHRWTIKQDGKQITVACVITHELGHSESVEFTAAPDDSGKKNAIQQVASTITYLERYTLMAACGLAARDMPDDDGRSSEREREQAPVQAITQEQYEALSDLMRTTGTVAADFLRYLNAGVDSLPDLPAVHFRRAKSALEAKAAKQAKEAANGLAA